MLPSLRIASPSPLLGTELCPHLLPTPRLGAVALSVPVLPSPPLLVARIPVRLHSLPPLGFGAVPIPVRRLLVPTPMPQLVRAATINLSLPPLLLAARIQVWFLTAQPLDLCEMWEVWLVPVLPLLLGAGATQLRLLAASPLLPVDAVLPLLSGSAEAVQVLAILAGAVLVGVTALRVLLLLQTAPTLRCSGRGDVSAVSAARRLVLRLRRPRLGHMQRPVTAATR